MGGNVGGVNDMSVTGDCNFTPSFQSRATYLCKMLLFMTLYVS